MCKQIYEAWGYLCGHWFPNESDVHKCKDAETSGTTCEEITLINGGTGDGKDKEGKDILKGPHCPYCSRQKEVPAWCLSKDAMFEKFNVPH